MLNRAVVTIYLKETTLKNHVRQTHTHCRFSVLNETPTHRRDGYTISRVDFSVSFSHSIRPRCAFACHEQWIREVKKKQYRQSGELKWWTWNRNSTIFNCHQNSHIRQSGKKILRFVWTHRRNWTSTVVFSFVSFQTEQFFFFGSFSTSICAPKTQRTPTKVCLTLFRCYCCCWVAS